MLSSHPPGVCACEISKPWLPCQRNEVIYNAHRNGYQLANRCLSLLIAVVCSDDCSMFDLASAGQISTSLLLVAGDQIDMVFSQFIVVSVTLDRATYIELCMVHRTVCFIREVLNHRQQA